MEDVAMRARALTVLGTLVLAFALLTQAARADEWSPGDEAETLGHTFSEEMWTVDNLTHETPEGANATFVVSYVNYSGAQAFLVALKNVTDDNFVSTLPYQLFGMHYTTPEGQEVFIGAVFAFLLAYRDTYNGTGPGSNGMPDPGNEDVYYVIPFGVGETLGDRTYAPIVEALPVEKLGDGHYRFGMRYRNMYAKIIDASNPLALILSLNFPLYIAKFSEFSVVYDVTIDPEAGTMRAETFYTLGQISDLWIWGVHGERADIPDNFGISVVHYVAMFTSNYEIEGAESGLEVDTGIQQPLDEDLDIRIGDRAERALRVGFRGTFDLTDEDTDERIQEDAPAYNILALARPWDLLLIAWQAGFSLHLMALMAYGLSSDIRARYDNPRDLIVNGSEDFTSAAFWYAVAFPGWRGYRVEHDPTYTAFFAPPFTEPGGVNAGGLILLGVLAVAVVVAVFLFRRRRRPSPAEQVTPEAPAAEGEAEWDEGELFDRTPPDEPGPTPDESISWSKEDDLD